MTTVVSVPQTVREVLYSADGRLFVTGVVREVLRSTGTGAGTAINVDGAVREVLRSTAGSPWPSGGAVVPPSVCVIT